MSNNIFRINNLQQIVKIVHYFTSHVKREKIINNNMDLSQKMKFNFSGNYLQLTMNIHKKSQKKNLTSRMKSKKSKEKYLGKFSQKIKFHFQNFFLSNCE